MEFIIVSVIYKSVLKLVLLFQTLQLIAQRPIAIIYEESKKMFTNKSPWGIKTHDNMRTQLNSCEQETPAGGKGEQLMLSPNQKEQLGTHTRKPSLWEWTKGCPLNFLSPPPPSHLMWTVSKGCHISWNLKNDGTPSSSPTTAPPTEGELKPNCSNSDKLMLKNAKYV